MGNKKDRLIPAFYQKTEQAINYGVPSAYFDECLRLLFVRSKKTDFGAWKKDFLSKNKSECQADLQEAYKFLMHQRPTQKKS